MQKFSGKILLMMLLVGLGTAGCSSLPKQPAPDTELNNRSAAYHRLGHKAYHAGDYTKAIVYYHEALKIHASVDDGAGVAHSFHSLGQAYLGLADLPQAENNFLTSLEATRPLSRPDLQARAYCGLARVQLEKDDPENAKSWLEKASALPLDESSPERAVVWHDLGVVQAELGDRTGAEEHLRLALDLHEKLNNKAGIAADCYALALMFEAAGNHQAALTMARRALSNDKSAGNAKGVAQDLKLLGILSEQQGEEETARDYNRRAELADTINQ